AGIRRPRTTSGQALLHEDHRGLGMDHVAALQRFVKAIDQHD
ncbi:MAG: hypothetical protein QOJ19_3309, partial [Acidimicrobiia bacterium]|nr:hypothetical protein [Acidimicrobiia bacterium]